MPATTVCCQKCGQTGAVQTVLYPYSNRRKKWNNAYLCSHCTRVLRELTSELRMFYVDCENDALCSCCDPGKAKAEELVRRMKKWYSYWHEPLPEEYLRKHVS